MRQFIFISFIFVTFLCEAQVRAFLPTDTQMYNYQVRQLTQFFERFNAHYDSTNLTTLDSELIDLSRQQQIAGLFNLEDSALIKNPYSIEFINTIVSSGNNLTIQYDDSTWYALAHCRVSFKGKQGLLSMALQPVKSELSEYKWVIVGVSPFIGLENNANDQEHIGISPYNHEINFIDLYKFFDSATNTSEFVGSNYRIDHLSILIYLINAGEIVFQGVAGINFYFFEIPGWCFMVKNNVRPTHANSGWLISGLWKVPDEEKPEFIYDKLFVSKKNY